MGTMNVLEAARFHGIKRVVVASSNVLGHFMAGGEGGGDPAREEAFPRPTTFYATTKQAVENLGLDYARWCGVEFAALRYGAVFGPWRGRGGGGPATSCARRCAGRWPARRRCCLGHMEWVYSKDAAHGTVLALKHPASEPGLQYHHGGGRGARRSRLGAAHRDPGERSASRRRPPQPLSLPDMPTHRICARTIRAWLHATVRPPGSVTGFHRVDGGKGRLARGPSYKDTDSTNPQSAPSMLVVWQWFRLSSPDL